MWVQWQRGEFPKSLLHIVKEGSDNKRTVCGRPIPTPTVDYVELYFLDDADEAMVCDKCSRSRYTTKG